MLALNVIFYSFLSGLFACLVSILIKFAFNTELFIELNNNWLKLSVQAGFICLSFVLNSLMWIFYSKSLQLSSNTLYSTALNKFCNFICSALFGFLLFKENINLINWLIGLFILLIGIVLLNDQQQDREQKTEQHSYTQEISKKSQ